MFAVLSYLLFMTRGVGDIPLVYTYCSLRVESGFGTVSKCRDTVGRTEARFGKKHLPELALRTVKASGEFGGMLGGLCRISASCPWKSLAGPCVGQVKVRSFCSGGKLSRQWTPLQVRKAARGFTFRTPVRKRITTSAAMASAPSKVIEHVVLFKVKEGTSQEANDAFLAALRGLRKLDMVLELTAGPLLSAVPLGFTHALHSRYKDKADLDAYLLHPDHQDVVINFVVPNSPDILSIDWEAKPEGNISEDQLGALRMGLLKPKAEAIKDGLTRVSEVVASFKSHASETSVGTNISPARAQGYEWGFLLRFDSSTALKEFSADPKTLQLQEETLKPLVESLIVLDIGNDSANQAKL